MKLNIAGLEEAGAYRGKITHCVATVDPEDADYFPRLGISTANLLCIYCHDVSSRAEARARERDFPGSKCIAPSRAMIERALNFAAGLTDSDVLLVLCGFGIARSTALALAIMAQAQPDLPEARVLRQLLKLRPQAAPNHLIVAHADRILGRNGRLVKVVDAFLERDR